MKFFWKLYLSIMIMTITCFSIGGYILIQFGFQNSLSQEIDSIYRENDICIASLQQQLEPTFIKYEDLNYSLNTIKNSVGSFNLQTFSGNLSFCLRDNDGQLIYQNGGFTNDHNFVKEVDKNQRGHKIIKNKEQFFLHALRPLKVGNINIYIENAHNITNLFQARNEQYQVFFYYTILLSFLSGIVIFLITRWLVHPIQKLSLATQKFANGDFIEDIPIQSQDEIGQLTYDFNTMSKRLRTSMKELQDSVERQEIFVGNFAHELKTPLTSIIGYGDMLRSRQLSNEQIVNYAHLIVQEGKRLENMSMKLMDLIVLKKHDFTMYHISAIAFFEIIENTLKPIMEQAQIHFMVDIEESDLWIEPDLMQTVFFNLLDNARKSVNQSGEISLIGKNHSNQYIVQVIDNGCGIYHKDLDKIKQAFYMADKSRSRSAGGAGLGLAITDEIIKLHHAFLTIESTPDIGTTVTVCLKRGENDEKN